MNHFFFSIDLIKGLSSLFILMPFNSLDLKSLLLPIEGTLCTNEIFIFIGSILCFNLVLLGPGEDVKINT